MSPNIAGFGPSDHSRNPAIVPMMADEAISYGEPSLSLARLGAYHEATAERKIINAEIKKIPQSPRNLARVFSTLSMPLEISSLEIV